MNIGIYIYDQAEVLDFCGPFEVFSTANRLAEQDGLFRVSLISAGSSRVNARGGLVVMADETLESHPELDVLIVVGGMHEAELKHPEALAWMRRVSESAQIVASVCTGAFLLAEAGVLTNQTVTTHWEDIPDLRAAYPRLKVLEHQRWVDTGKYVTSGGISAGIDMSLHLVSRLAGLDLAERTAKQMEFDWRRV